MKELSIEEKAKRYDEAIKKAEVLYKAAEPMSGCNVLLETVFPELKESEDERIKKDIISYIQLANQFIPQFQKDKWIAWLEKQGQHAKFINNIQIGDQVTRNEDGMLINLSQLNRVAKHSDKVEPKFHEGEWIIHHGTENIYQVVTCVDNHYELKYGDNYTVQKCADVDRCARLWDITKDAKDGDMLACNEEILLFKSYSVQGRISLYCWYNGQTNNFHSKEVVDALMTTRNKICPATKEQRDTLEKAITNAGYRWDKEKLKLEKAWFKVKDFPMNN